MSKISGRYISGGISINSFLKINLILWKKALLHIDGSEMTFVAGATKVNLAKLWSSW